ncbi:glycolate oxidase subunit GlcF [Methylococcus sp. EFPC2]|uniref:glycolate oxidase subunit GlcF n=1 Tax=Methylococcus sp. EFPC2 TaxID=2812648 RepID=UPI00196894E8|nr:glycolate oxidase subunit GlcF [Methylococcus sp. EFPC2]QSA97715.1 glycolate oxidase subunit GlcF [Methylococcus sp. EFPC2]
MQTRLAEFIKATPDGDEAEAILRSCVHCGFCTATCPTYQLLGDERDGPRGRIYLIKQVLEGERPSARTRGHLDRCLSCRSCETTCPSGVRYGHLLDIARRVVDQQAPRPWPDKLVRRALRAVLPYPSRFARLARLASGLRPLLPASLRGKLPALPGPDAWPAGRHARKMLLLEGCVQPTLAPAINAATARVLDRLNIQAIRAEGAGCCGALSHHLSAHEEGLGFMRRNIDTWWPYLEQGAEAIVMTASGCGLMVKEYAEVLKHDQAYAEKASRVSALTFDLAEVLAREDTSRLTIRPRRLAYQSPCTLQHGQKLAGAVEDLLTRLGFELTPVADPHLCCGSAGSYSLLQPELAGRLLDNKLAALQAGQPELIATANIGCLSHLQSAARVPVRHWVELLDPQTPGPA